MKRLRNFMLRLIGMYIPFVLVILGIGACSFVYKDELFGRFNSTEEQETEVETVEPEPTFDEIVTEEPTEPESEIVDEGTESSTDSGLPPIGECVCPDR